MSLPIITIPNDDNSSDILVLQSNGDVVTASELIKGDPILKGLVSKKIKLMADGESATPHKPQVRIAKLNGQIYASLSFFCSTDNYGRKTSSSLVFEVSEKDQLIEMFGLPNIPVSVSAERDALIGFIKKFNYRFYELISDNSLTTKKKAYW